MVPVVLHLPGNAAKQANIASLSESLLHNSKYFILGLISEVLTPSGFLLEPGRGAG